MKRLLLSVVIASTLGLTACGGKSSNEHKDDAVPAVPQAHLGFQPDPTAVDTEIPLPSDIIFSGTKDGTLEQIPGKETGNFSDPAIALGALDGWSTVEPISVKVNFPQYDSQQNPVTDLTVYKNSVQQAGAIRLFEVQRSGPLAFVGSCKTADSADSIKVCKIEKELTYGVDFETRVVGNQIDIVPLKPLKQNHSYLYVFTDKIIDSYERPIAGSATFNILKSDSSLPSKDQRDLQAAVHSYDKHLSENGVDPLTVTYSSMFTTQSISNVIDVTKAKMAADFGAGFNSDGSVNGNFGPYAPTLVPVGLLDNGKPKFVEQVLNDDDTPKTAADALNFGDNIPPETATKLKLILSNAMIYHAKLKLPIFSACSSVKCLDADGTTLSINGRWKAAGDSPLAVLSAVQNGTLSVTDFETQAKAQGVVDPQKARSTPSLLVGKHFTLPDGSPVDKNKLLTRYNPLPAIQLDENGQPLYETVDVQITIPKEQHNPLSILDFDSPIPNAGYPISIGMHGIGTVRQTSLVYSGIFAANIPEELKPFLKQQFGLDIQDKKPVATITIDMPLHGERSFRKANSGPYDVSATESDGLQTFGLDPDLFTENGSVLNFVRVQSPLTIRANFRQATIDQLALRLVLPVISKQLLAINPEWGVKTQIGQLTTGVFNTNQVTVAGLSLGAMISTSFTAAANSGIVDPSTNKLSSTNPYKIQGVSLVAPAGGLAGAFAGSQSFGPQLFTNIKQDSSFKALAAALAQKAGKSPDDESIIQAAYQQFIPPFGFAVQTVIDPIDPINFSPLIAQLNDKNSANHNDTNVDVHLIEIVGDGEGGTNPSDQTLPNRFNGLPIIDDAGDAQTLSVADFPLAGTEPMITELGISCADLTAGAPVTVNEGAGVVRFLKGKHSSLIDPTPIEGLNADTFQSVTEDMQAMVSVFAATAGSGKGEIETAKDGLIKTCPTQ